MRSLAGIRRERYWGRGDEEAAVRREQPGFEVVRDSQPIYEERLKQEAAHLSSMK